MLCYAEQSNVWHNYMNIVIWSLLKQEYYIMLCRAIKCMAGVTSSSHGLTQGALTAAQGKNWLWRGKKTLAKMGK